MSFTDSIETFENEATGIKAHVVYDMDGGSDSPRDWDNCWSLFGFKNPHRRFGDEEIDIDYHHEMSCGEFDLGEYLREQHDAHLIVPVHVYDHGLVRYYAGEVTTESWDTGAAGVAIITKQTLDSEFEGDEEKARKYLDGELETYTDWCNGSIYGYFIEDAEGNRLEDECWGIYGFDYACEEAKRALKDEVQSWLDEQAAVRYWAEREVETTS